MKINLGSGKTALEGYLGIDIVDFGNNMVWDVSKGLPFEDNSLDEVYASHFLEHSTDLISLMNEIWRVLKKDGVLKIVVPHINNPRAFVANHNYFFNKESIRFFGRDDVPEIKKWKITELVKNKRPDIHAILKPVDKVSIKYPEQKSYKLELGCGKKIEEGYIGIDIHPDYGQICRDLEKQCIPFRSGSVSVIRAMSFLEHIENLEFVMNECWRVLQPGGILKINVPHYLSAAAYTDPTHKRFFSLGTFKYFTGERPRYAQYNFKQWKINNIKELELNEGIIDAELEKKT